MTGLVVILRDVIALAALLAVIGLVYGVLGWLFAQPLVLLVLAIALVGGRCWFCFRRAYPVGSIDGRLTPPSLPGPSSLS